MGCYINGAALRNNLLGDLNERLPTSKSLGVIENAYCYAVHIGNSWHFTSRKAFGAAEKTRTSTGVTPQRPQRCASTIPPQPHCH